MGPKTLSLFLFLAILPGCGKEMEGAGGALPAGNLLQRLPADSLFALSCPEGAEPGSSTIQALGLLGFNPSETGLLLHSRGFSAARTEKGVIAIFRGSAGEVGAQGEIPPLEGGLTLISRPRIPWGDTTALGGTRPWLVLSRAAAPWKGDLLCWISLARILEGNLPSAPGRGGKSPGRGLPGPLRHFLESSRLKEVLNMEAFEAVLVRVEEEKRARCGIFVWPDRVGLPGVLLPERGGLRGEIPPRNRIFLAWRIAPRGLASILVGLESIQGAAGGLIRTGLGFFRDRTGLDPARDLVPALEGPLVLSAGPKGGTLTVALGEGAAGVRLRRAITSKGKLAQAVKALSGGRLRLHVSGKDLLLQWGGKGGPAPPLFQPDPGSSIVGFLRLPLRLPGGGKDVLLQGEFRRAPYGLEARFKMNPDDS